MTRVAARARWYVRRLRSMPPREVVERALAYPRIATLRIESPVERFRPAARANSTALSRLSRLLADASAFAGEDARKWQHRILDEVRDRHILVFGRTVELGSPAFGWDADVVTGARLPARYGPHLPTTALDGCSDPKYTVELNRLQFLVPATMAGYTTDELDGIVGDWRRSTGRFRGPAWSSGIEAAMRATSLVLASAALGEAHPSTLVREAVADSARYLSVVRSTGSSANNHRVAELAAAYVLRRAFYSATERELEGTARELVETCTALFSDEGVPLEQSIPYGIQVVEWMLVVAAVMDPGQLRESLQTLSRSAVSAIATLSDCAGNWPAFGDSDDGTVFLGVVPAHRRLAVLAGLTGAGGPPTDRGTLSTLSGGYSIARDRTPAGIEVMWVLDHGDIGWNALAAHGHADALSVWLHIDGHPVLVDAGTGKYYGDLALRARMRSTASHNTVTIARESSSISDGPFLWSRKDRAAARLTAATGGDRWRVSAEHDGYARRLGLTHRRDLEALGGGRYRVTDDVVGHTVAACTANYLVAHDLTVRAAESGDVTILRGEDQLLTVRAWRITGDQRVTCRPNVDVTAEISPSFGVVTTTTRIGYDFVSTDKAFVTEFVVGEPGNAA